MSETNGDTWRDGQWLKIGVMTPAPLVESVSDLLGVLSGAGVELSPENRDGVRISAFFRAPADPDAGKQLLVDLRARLAELFALYDQPMPSLVQEFFPDQDWATSWQQYFRPFEVVPGLVIRPSWEEYAPAAGEQVIMMDPGQAFGTGQHASTSMALDLLRISLQNVENARVLDVGCGTGILAMAAALFGAETVLAIDNDPEAVRVARENIAANHLTRTIRVSGRSLTDTEGSFDLICANIIHNVLVEMAPELVVRLAPGGRLVLAGILAGEQEENIVRVYEELGCRPEERRHTDEWTALRLTKTAQEKKCRK